MSSIPLTAHYYDRETDTFLTPEEWRRKQKSKEVKVKGPKQDLLTYLRNKRK